MSRSHRRIRVAAALLPLFLTVEVAAAPGTDPTRADAIVIGQPFESVFKTYQPASDETTSPDKLWRGANDSVAGQGGHGGMAGMSIGGPTTMPMPGSDEKSMPMEMKMQDGQAMPTGKSMPSQKTAPPARTASPSGHAGMQMPGAKSKPMDMKMPMDHTMPMPADHAMPMGKGIPMPMDKGMPMPKKAPKQTPAPAAAMPPGMDMHEGHKGK